MSQVSDFRRFVGTLSDASAYSDAQLAASLLRVQVGAAPVAVQYSAVDDDIERFLVGDHPQLPFDETPEPIGDVDDVGLLHHLGLERLHAEAIAEDLPADGAVSRGDFVYREGSETGCCAKCKFYVPDPEVPDRLGKCVLFGELALADDERFRLMSEVAPAMMCNAIEIVDDESDTEGLESPLLDAEGDESVDDEIDDDPFAWVAQRYADSWNALEASGRDVPRAETESADTQLSGSGWGVDWNGELWQVVDYPLDYARMHAPRGGVTVFGRFYRGGMFLPGRAENSYYLGGVARAQNKTARKPAKDKSPKPKAEKKLPVSAKAGGPEEIHAAGRAIANAFNGKAHAEAPSWMPHKVHIVDLYDKLKADGQLGDKSLDEFKADLLAAHQRGEIRLVRTDLPQATDSIKKVQDSAIRHLDAEFNLLEVPPTPKTDFTPDPHWGSPDQPLWRPGPNPTVDNVITRTNPKTGEEEVLLIQRREGTVEGGKWAMPGGFHDSEWSDDALKATGLTREQVKDLPNVPKPYPKGSLPPAGFAWTAGKETAEEAALRELEEETGLKAGSLKGSLKEVGVYEGGGAGEYQEKRDPRDNREAWTKSSAFKVHLSAEQAKAMDKPEGQDDASAAKWVPVKDLAGMKLAFDHGKILKDAGVEPPTPPPLTEESIQDSIKAKKAEEEHAASDRRKFSPDASTVKPRPMRTAGLIKAVGGVSARSTGATLAKEHGLATNGNFLMRIPEKERAAFASIPGGGADERSVAFILKKSEEWLKSPADPKPAEIVGARELHEEAGRGSKKKTEKQPQYLIKSPSGKTALLNADYVQTILSRYPGATMHLAPRKPEGKPVMFKVGGETVAVLMPMEQKESPEFHRANLNSATKTSKDDIRDRADHGNNKPERSDPMRSNEMVSDIRDALARIRTDEVTFGSLNELAKRMDDLSKADAMAVVREFGIEGTSRTRKEAMERVRVLLQSAKESANSASW